MKKLIKKIDSETEIYFDTGKFDNWCVYIKDSSGIKAPLDIEYFSFFKELAEDCSAQRVYDEFVSIYLKVTDNLSQEVVNFIISIAKNYPNPISRDVAINFIVIYAGMIAERNKEFAILKERIKRLGMHQILIEGMSVYDAANYSKAKKWRDLDKLCKSKGF